MSIFNQNDNTTELSSSDEIDLSLVLNFLKQSYKSIIVSAVVCIACTYLVIVATPPLYKADAVIQVESKSAGFDMEGLMPLAGEAPETQTESELIRSRMVLSRAVADTEFSTQITPKKLPFVADFIARKLSLSKEELKFLAPYSLSNDTITVDAFEVVEHRQDEVFSLRWLGESKYLVINSAGQVIIQGEIGQLAKSPNGDVRLKVSDISAELNTEFILSSLSVYSSIEKLKSKLTVSGVGRKTDLLSLEYTSKDKQQAVAIVKAIYNNYISQNVQRGAQKAENGLVFLEDQIPQAKHAMARAEKMLNDFQLSHNSVDISIETEAVLERIGALELKAESLETKEAELSKQYTKNHPKYAALLDVRKQVNDDISQISSQIKTLPNTQQEMFRLAREAKLKQEIYMKMLGTAQELAIAKAGEIGNVRLIDEAAANPVAVNSGKALKLALSALIGAMIGAGITFIKINLNKGILREDQIESIGSPVLASLPLSDAQLKLNKGHKGEQSVLASYAPSDLTIEALRSLRTSLLYGSLADRDNKNIMISGASPAAGKSFLSTNLAVVCAEIGEKILLIDADMRKGYIHKSFSLENNIGLADLLKGEAELELVVQGCNVDGLDIISRGTIPHNPSELLCKPEFADLLKSLSSRYDRIIIDTPPILAVTDAAIIGDHCGKNLLTVRWGETHLKEIQQSISRFKKCNVKIDGAVLNGIKKSGSGYDMYDYYQYSYKSVSN